MAKASRVACVNASGAYYSPVSLRKPRPVTVRSTVPVRAEPAYTLSARWSPFRARVREIRRAKSELLKLAPDAAHTERVCVRIECIAERVIAVVPVSRSV